MESCFATVGCHAKLVAGIQGELQLLVNPMRSAASVGVVLGGLATLISASLVALSVTDEPATAQEAFYCGREDHERLYEPGAVWFEHHRRRSEIAALLLKNGNHDLANRFDACGWEALRRSAEFGKVEAQYFYGLHLLDRKPATAAATAEAREWLKKAAAQGHERAKLLVATWPKR